MSESNPLSDLYKVLQEEGRRTAERNREFMKSLGEPDHTYFDVNAYEFGIWIRDTEVIIAPRKQDGTYSFNNKKIWDRPLFDHVVQAFKGGSSIEEIP